MQQPDILAEDSQDLSLWPDLSILGSMSINDSSYANFSSVSFNTVLDPINDIDSLKSLLDPQHWIVRSVLDNGWQVLFRMRLLFYLVWPSEIMFPSLDQVPRFVTEVSRMNRARRRPTYRQLHTNQLVRLRCAQDVPRVCYCCRARECCQTYPRPTGASSQRVDCITERGYLSGVFQDKGPKYRGAHVLSGLAALQAGHLVVELPLDLVVLLHRR